MQLNSCLLRRKQNYKGPSGKGSLKLNRKNFSSQVALAFFCSISSFPRFEFWWFQTNGLSVGFGWGYFLLLAVFCYWKQKLGDKTKEINPSSVWSKISVSIQLIWSMKRQVKVYYKNCSNNCCFKRKFGNNFRSFHCPGGLRFKLLRMQSH